MLGYQPWNCSALCDVISLVVQKWAAELRMGISMERIDGLSIIDDVRQLKRIAGDQIFRWRK